MKNKDLQLEIKYSDSKSKYIIDPKDIVYCFFQASNKSAIISTTAVNHTTNSKVQQEKLRQVIEQYKLIHMPTHNQPNLYFQVNHIEYIMEFDKKYLISYHNEHTLEVNKTPELESILLTKFHFIKTSFMALSKKNKYLINPDKILKIEPNIDHPKQRTTLQISVSSIDVDEDYLSITNRVSNVYKHKTILENL